MDPVTTIPACRHKTCGARPGDRNCYTPTGFVRHWHVIRVNDAAAGDQTTEPDRAPAGRLAGRRPSEKQAGILAQAVHNGGLYEMSGYSFAGDAQRRAATLSMAGEERGWFQHVRETQHGTLYEITPAGRDALARWDAWMNGGTT